MPYIYIIYIYKENKKEHKPIQSIKWERTYSLNAPKGVFASTLRATFISPWNLGTKYSEPWYCNFPT